LTREEGLAERGVDEGGVGRPKGEPGSQAETANTHGGDGELVAWRLGEEMRELRQISGVVGAGNEFEDIRAKGSGGSREPVEFVPTKRVIQPMDRKNEPDPLFPDAAEKGTHLPNEGQFEIDKGRLIEKALEKRAPGCERKAVAAAFGRGTRGQDQRCAEPRELAFDFV